MNRNDFPGQLRRTQRRTAIFLAIVAMFGVGVGMATGNTWMGLFGIFGGVAVVLWRGPRH